MDLVILTALGVGGATLVGVVIGFVFKNITHKFSDIVLSFAAGVFSDLEEAFSVIVPVAALEFKAVFPQRDHIPRLCASE